MQEHEPSEKLPTVCRRLAIAAVLLALFMIPAAIALRFLGLSAALAVLGAEIGLACWMVRLRLRAAGASLAEYLTTSESTGPHMHPAVLLLGGCVFWGPGLYIILTATEPPDPAPNQLTVIEQTWFGTTFLLMGLGVSGLGLAGRLARRATARAVVRLTEQLRVDPRNADCFYRRGVLLQELGALQQAVDDFSEVIGLAPDRVAAYLERGDLHYRLKDYRQALADYSTAIGHDPENVEAHAKRGWIYEELGQPERAAADLAKAEALGREQAAQ